MNQSLFPFPFLVLIRGLRDVGAGASDFDVEMHLSRIPEHRQRAAYVILFSFFIFGFSMYVPVDQNDKTTQEARMNPTSSFSILDAAVAVLLVDPNYGTLSPYSLVSTRTIVWICRTNQCLIACWVGLDNGGTNFGPPPVHGWW
jgi:hypothetical protein